jgi:hypothetical protein
MSDELLEEAAAKIGAAIEADTPLESELSVDDVDEVEVADDDVEDFDNSDDADAAEIDKARRSGWRPIDEFKGDKKLWKDYKEFNAEGDRIASRLSSKIDNLATQNRKQQEMIKKLVASQGQVAKQAYDDAVRKLRSERREAIKDGDVDQVELIDEKLDVLGKQQPITEPDEPEVPEIDDYTRQFIDDNKHWFNKENPAMVRYAISMERLEQEADPDASPDEIFDRVRAAVSQRYPGRVDRKPQQSRRQRPAAPVVEDGATPVRGNAVAQRFSELPKVAQEIAEAFERDGVMTKKQYMEEYRKGLA